ncbi:MAG: glycosyltransferase [Bacteroidaceae bacterium]|nr:glycosyltransferase [Bacteroidaceae bacterium]
MYPEALISIIVPVYNTEKFIHRCLDSIAAQTYTNWEAILVDDGSPDNAGRICDEYAANDKRFKVIHQKNHGVVNARNNAIAKARGEFLAFVDSDDFIEPTMLEEMSSAAIKKHADIVWCCAKAIFKEGIVERTLDINSEPVESIKRLITGQLPGWLCIKLINRDFWNKCNIRTDENAVIYEDTFISIQLMAHNPRMEYVDKPLYNYVRLNENAATHNLDISKAERNIQHIYDYLKEFSLYDVCKNEFTEMALTFKIQLLRQDIKKACRLYPFAHRRFRNFKFPFKTSAFYWVAFNTGALGRFMFKLHFK